jgi:hypothetical protein
MIWIDYDEAHLAFYERLIGRYHDLEALHTDAALEPLERPADAAVTLFVRDASGVVDADPERVLVVLNFEADPVTVDLPTGIDSTNLLEDVDRTVLDDEERDGSEQGVTVRTVGVFEIEESVDPFDGTPTVRRPSDGA